MRTLLCLLLAVLLAPAAASAHSHKQKGLEIIHPWTRATADASVTTVVVCMTIKNRSGVADRLIGATTPLAANVEVRQQDGKIAALPVGSGKTVGLKRNGAHLLLTGFKRRLDAYESFVMTLVFEKAGQIVVEVMVEEMEQPKR
jgi:periplasmic copper chaperone A